MLKQKRYKGSFNWHGELHTLWAHAKDDKQAFYRMTARLAVKLGYLVYYVRQYFLDPKRDAYIIREK